jgi:membrane protease YdiL (CAAX protease family)
VNQQLSVPWKGRDALVVFLVPWVILPILALIWLSALSPFVPQVHQFVQALDTDSPTASFGLVILDAVGSFALIAYYLRKYGASIRDLGIRRFNFLKAAATVALTVIGFFILIAIILALVSAFLPGFNPNQAQTNEFTHVAPQFRLYSFLALVVIPPRVEEPVFRGFMFPAFAKRWGLMGGALISSILFGVAHLQANVSVYTLVLGLILCMLYARFGSIIPGIALHMLNNYLAYSALNQ